MPPLRPLLLAAVTLAGCTVVERPVLLPSEPGFGGFPARRQAGPYEVAALLDEESAERLGVDLVERAGVLPVRLQVLAGRGTPATRLRAARLYLTDGTVLAATERGARSLAAAGGVPLVPGPEGPVLEAGATLVGELLFELGPELRIQRHFALTLRDGVYREVDLHEGLIALELEGWVEPLRVGVAPFGGRVAAR